MQIFNEHFTSISPSLAENIDNNRCDFSQFVHRVDRSFHFQPVSSSQVYKFLNSLSVCKATGIDKISAKVLKLAVPVVSESLDFQQVTCLACFSYRVEGGSSKRPS